MKKNLVMVTEPVWNYVLKKFEVRYKYEKKPKELKLFKRKEKARIFANKLLAEK